MDIQSIQEFIDLAQSGSFSNTAERFGITQSALSKHIKQLEAELGAPLLAHINKKTRLNEFGELFLPYAKQIAETQQQFFQLINRRHFSTDKVLRIGVPLTMEFYDTSDIITQFGSAYPDISIEMQEGETGFLTDQILSNQLDIIFATETSENRADGFSRLSFARDVLVALLPADHPLAQRDHVTLSALQGENFLLLPESSLLHSLCLDLFKTSGISPNIIFKGTGDTVHKAVSAGLGVSLMARKPLSGYPKSPIVQVELRPSVPVYINMMYLQLEKDSPTDKFVRFMQETIFNQQNKRT